MTPTEPAFDDVAIERRTGTATQVECRGCHRTHYVGYRLTDERPDSLLCPKCFADWLYENDAEVTIGEINP